MYNLFFIFHFSFVSLLLSAGCGAQPSLPATPPDSLLRAAREIMSTAGNCALITTDSLGSPQARIMDPFAPDSQMIVWLATNPRSRKVRQIKNQPQVTLFYFDKAGGAYVSINGRAVLVDDPQEKQLRWKAEWEPFYPDRRQDYLLIKVIPTRIEVVSIKHNIIGDDATWTVPAIELQPHR